MTDDEIRPFRLDIPQERLDDLADRLARTRWPDELPDAGDDYGLPLEFVRELTEHWRTRYDWRVHEAELNGLGLFETIVDGADIRFLHVRSPEPDAFPLILTHGWPGSVVEFLDVIGPLSDPRAYGGDPADAFDLVIPSIPGYGLSGPTWQRGWDVPRVARAWAELMGRLGYRRYGAQGGDWGSPISRWVAEVDPAAVAAVHVNYLPVAPPDDVTGLSDQDLDRVARTREFLKNPSGHMVQQSTRPQTLAYGLADSPVGQLAWIADKFWEWADPASLINPDRLLTNVMLYWATGTAGSSSRLHRESAGIRGAGIPCPAPLGVAVLPYDLTLSIRGLAERAYKIHHWSEFARGGHFAALEVPDLFAADLRTFFRAFR